ncbi:phenylacetate--CoA ligase family protein [Clostridiaceae bacterium]|nr:phenylacetate--CoA ligase family protein [Clostridiaceae bacterium]RKI16914.1 phenylacetate--CoA ligase family protein [bacterium 1XD21-70]
MDPIHKFRVGIYRDFVAKAKRLNEYNGLFWETYAMLEKTDSWGISQFREYQLQKIISLIQFAYKNTKYYRSMFDEHGWKPENFQNFHDLKKIPILTKDILKNNLNELRAIPLHKCVAVTTGGSTGIPTKIFLDARNTEAIRLAFVWRSFHEGGYYFGDKIAILRGKVIGSENILTDHKNNILYCSSMNMSEKNMRKYLYQIQKFGTRHIRAYPSSAELLAKYIKDTGTTFNENGKIKTLFTSSETLTSDVRELIEEQLHVKVVDLYGNSEQIGMIGQCRGGHYHEYMCHSYLEYLDDDNKSVKTGEGRIIGTGFINQAMPLIRYDTGDVALLGKNYLEGCVNRQRVISSIAGRHRKDEFLIGREENLVNFVAINTHVDIFDRIYRYQFVQEKKGHVRINVMPGRGYTDADNRNIYREFKKRLGETFDIEVCETNQFEYTLRGKSKLLVQKLISESKY